MELLDLGEHCALAECKQLAYIFTDCNACNASFCSDHRTYEAHKCPVGRKDKRVDLVRCRDCSREVAVQIGQNAEDVLETHRLEKDSCKPPARCSVDVLLSVLLSH